jgi:glycosyltransferase involved in cell wall biosynthesis
MISIITVVYNGAKTIKDTIESVCTQTVLPTEYLIIDGASTDNTLSIVKSYMQRYPFIKLVSEPDRGIYDAMNKGLALVSGELIGILNSDDWYERGALEKMWNAYQAGGSGVYYGILRYLKNDEDFYLERVSQKFAGERMIPHPATFVSKDIYDRYGHFSLDYKYAADLEWLLRLVKQKVTFRHLDEIISNFRIGGASESFKADLEALIIRKSYGYINYPQYVQRLIALRLRHLIH